MTISFDDALLGHWTNRYQAQSNPLGFASVELEWSIDYSDVDQIWYKSKIITEKRVRTNLIEVGDIKCLL